MAKKFSELTKDFSPERRARIVERKDELHREMDLAELRKALALTQSTLAEIWFRCLCHEPTPVVQISLSRLS